MPRRRSECIPRHRAQRRKAPSGRGVRVTAAAHGPAAAGGTRARGAGRGSRARAGTFASRWVRATFITPWFAAGAGVVVAAILALEAPHQVLSFGPPAYQHCSAQRCESRSAGDRLAGHQHARHACRARAAGQSPVAEDRAARPFRGPRSFPVASRCRVTRRGAPGDSTRHCAFPADQAAPAGHSRSSGPALLCRSSGRQPECRAAAVISG